MHKTLIRSQKLQPQGLLTQLQRRKAYLTLLLRSLVKALLQQTLLQLLHNKLLANLLPQLRRDPASKEGYPWRCYSTRRTRAKADNIYSAQKGFTYWNTTNQFNSEQEEKATSCITTRFTLGPLEEFLQKTINLSAVATSTRLTTWEYPLQAHFSLF